MGYRLDEHLPPLDEHTAREHADALHRIGKQHGITELRFASPGRLVGHLDEHTDMGDMADFELDVIDLVGRDVAIFSDRVLNRPHVSPDLPAAQPL